MTSSHALFNYIHNLKLFTRMHNRCEHCLLFYVCTQIVKLSVELQTLSSFQIYIIMCDNDCHKSSCHTIQIYIVVIVITCMLHICCINNQLQAPYPYSYVLCLYILTIFFIKLYNANDLCINPQPESACSANLWHMLVYVAP